MQYCTLLHRNEPPIVSAYLVKTKQREFVEVWMALSDSGTVFMQLSRI